MHQNVSYAGHPLLGAISKDYGEKPWLWYRGNRVYINVYTQRQRQGNLRDTSVYWNQCSPQILSFLLQKLRQINEENPGRHDIYVSKKAKMTV